MKNYYFNFLVLSSIVLHSCEQQVDGDPNYGYIGDQTKIEGKVLEYGTNKILEGAMVILEETVTTGFFTGNVIVTPIDTFIKDTSGKYLFEFKHEEDSEDLSQLYRYRVRAEMPEYYGSDDRAAHKGYWTRRRVIILDPNAWIKVHIKNVNPFEENDIFSVTSSRGGGDKIY